MVGVHFELRVGILYTLYLLYSAQPQAHERVRIKVTQGIVHKFGNRATSARPLTWRRA